MELIYSGLESKKQRVEGVLVVYWRITLWKWPKLLGQFHSKCLMFVDMNALLQEDLVCGKWRFVNVFVAGRGEVIAQGFR